MIGAGGAIGGAFAGNKLADAYDNHKIYNQPDAQGQTWRYDPSQPQQGWTRDLPPLPQTPHGQRLTADPALAERLTFQANNTAVDLALAHPATPRDPYTQPAGPKDTPSQIDAPWTRDAQTQQWSRTVTDQVMEHGLKSTHVENATPLRAAELDTAARQTIAANLAASPRGIAEHYQAVYEQRGWQTQGPMPEAVTHALKAPANTLDASSGHTYTRSAEGQKDRRAEGQWTTPGTLYGTNAAAGNVRQELDATHAARMDAEQSHGIAPPAQAAEAPSAFVREMSVKIERFDKAMQAGDRAAMMREVEYVYETPEWKAGLARAREAVDKEAQQREQYRAEQPRDPRDAGHPDHAMNQGIRQQVETLHTRAGTFIGNKELDHLTASVANDARQQGMTRVDQVQFNQDKTSIIATQQNGQHDMWAKHSATNIQQAMQTPPEHAYQQMGQETQRQAQVQQNIQQQTVQSQQHGPSLGR